MQELGQTHGETLPRIKGNMTFEKNVRVCLWCGGGLGVALGGGRSGMAWRRAAGAGSGLGSSPCPSRLRFPPPSPVSLRWSLLAGPRVLLSLPPSFISELKLEGKCNPRTPTKGGKIKPGRLPTPSASEHSSLLASPASSPRPSSAAALGAEPGQLRTSLGSPGAGGSPGRARGRTGGEGWEPPRPLRRSGLLGQPSPVSLPAEPVSH